MTQRHLQTHSPINASRFSQRLSTRALRRSVTPIALLAVTGFAHAQGTIDFTGAQGVMSSFKTFALYAGGIICFISLIWAGIRTMSGRFQESIPGLCGALFGAGVLGWGAGWIGSLTGQQQ